MQGGDEASIKKESEEFLSAMKILETSPKWKQSSDKAVKVWEMDVEGRVVIKAETTINTPYEKAVEFFKDGAFMKKLQDNVIKLDVVWSNDNLRVLHGVMKMPGPISNRQIVVVNTVKIDGDRAVIGNRSCNFPVQLEKDA